MDLFFRQYGSGRDLIILHGLFGSSDNWITIGRTLSTDFKVLIPDLRNHGNSPFSNDHSYMELSNDINDFMKRQNIDKAVILGHSMGGKAAMVFASEHPDKVRALIIVDISPGSYNNPDLTDLSAGIHTNIINSLLSIDLKTVHKREDADRLLMQTIKSKRIRQFLLKNLQRDHNGLFSWKINLRAIHDNLHLIMGSPGFDKVIGTGGLDNFPVLFIKGEKSDYINDEDTQLIMSIFPKAKIVSVPDADHWVHAQQPGFFIQTLHSFFRDNNIL